MQKNNRMWTLGGIITIPITILLLACPLMTSLLSHYLLKGKETELLDYQRERNSILEHNILYQMERFKFDCSKDDLSLLLDPTFYNHDVRLVGINPEKGEGCSTLGPGIAILKDVKDNSLDGKLMISTTRTLSNPANEVLIYTKNHGGVAFWILDNSGIYDLLNKSCNECFYVEFSQKTSSSDELFLPRGNADIKRESKAINSIVVELDGKITQALWAGGKLNKYAKKLYLTYGIPIAIIITLIVLACYLILVNYEVGLDRQLRIAINRREFQPFYQPIINVHDKRVVGYEALVRWKKRDEYISPSVFIDYAETHGLIVEITSILMDHILRDLSKLSPDKWVSINLVAAHIESPILREYLYSNKWPDSRRMSFELTERLPISNFAIAASEITILNELGYQFKIDDFGTGYGGFSYLQRLGVHSIKIDKMFIDTIGTDDLKAKTLDAIINVGHELGMEIIAEGVETREQVDYLLTHGVNLMQGFFFSKPLPLELVLEAPLHID